MSLRIKTQPEGAAMAVDDFRTTRCATMTLPLVAPTGNAMVSAVLPVPLFAIVEATKAIPDD